MADITQGPITPGQPSLVTALLRAAGGQTNRLPFISPPGARTELPADMVRKSDLSEYISGTFAMGANDLPVIGFHYNGVDGSMMAILGNPDAPSFAHIPTNSYLSTVLGNGTGPIKCGIAQNCVHGTLITFQQAFSTDNVAVVVSGSDDSSTHVRFPLVFSKPDRNGFRVSLNYWNGSGTSGEATPSTIYYMAVEIAG